MLARIISLKHVTGHPEVIAELETVDGMVTIRTKDCKLLEKLHAGIVCRSGKTFTIADGDDFIRAMPQGFSDDYMRVQISDQ